MSDSLLLNLAKFRWVSAELSPIEKDAQSGGYKWQRKDGSWWTNHNGQIMPYNETEHGPRDAHAHGDKLSAMQEHLEGHHFHDIASKRLDPKAFGGDAAAALDRIREHTSAKDFHRNKVLELQDSLGDAVSPEEHAAFDRAAHTKARDIYRDLSADPYRRTKESRQYKKLKPVSPKKS